MPDMLQDEPTQRMGLLAAEVEEKLPEFAKACREKESEALLLHQDAFAADYQEGEYALLGKAVKYAGLFGKEIHIVGKNKTTLSRKQSITQ